MDEQQIVDLARRELKRSEYLSAMGIDSYVSRRPLPGAMESRRMVVLPSRAGEDATSRTEAGPSALKSAGAAGGQARGRHGPDSADPVAELTLQGSAAASASADRFSLAAIVAGGFLWIEELQDMPLARDQTRLVMAMARALGESGSSGDEPGPDITQFNWPIHNNAQLDQGEEAARAALVGFISRKLNQHRCQGLIVLGKACADRIPVEELPPLASGTLPATIDMLRKPHLKKEAWGALSGMLRSR